MKKIVRNLTLVLFSLTLVLSPLYVVRWEYAGSLPTTLLETLIIGSVLSYLLYKWSIREPFFHIIPKIWPGIVLFLLGSTIGLLVTPNAWEGFGIYRAYFLEPLFFGIVLIDALINGSLLPKLSQFLIKSITAAGVWTSILGLLQALLGWYVITPHQFDRAHAVFNNGNALALFIGPLAAFYLYQLFKQRKFLSWNSVLMVLFLITLLFTKSTGGLLAMLLTAISVFLLRWHKNGSSIIAYGILSVIVLFLSFLPFVGFIAPNVDNPWVRPGGTAQIRLCIWEGTANLLKDNPITGAGVRGFQELYSTKYVTCDAEPLVYPHNILLNFWVEIGVFGLLGCIFIFYLTAKKANIYTPLFLYTFFHGMVDVPYFKNDLALLFWVFIALWEYQNYESDSGVG